VRSATATAACHMASSPATQACATTTSAAAPATTARAVGYES
jgi:hypothetical protein